ncbi:JAB domain-containing protein, partial [Paracoccus seriniphilus]|uniref:JAB domain-containing protein n=1 Tax=Paracoccus seriniphilus TaxID=184748 RepID=UPI003561C979
MVQAASARTPALERLSFLNKVLSPHGLSMKGNPTRANSVLKPESERSDLSHFIRIAFHGLSTIMSTVPEEPHWKGHRERLRGKLLTRGASSLSNYEVLEVLLMAFIPRRDVKPIAKALEARFGSLSAILAAPVADLVKVDGVGATVAAYLKAISELNARAARETIQQKPAISSWSALIDYVRTELQHEKREQFRILFLDRKNQLIADEIMGHGTVDHAPVYTREVARRALEL